MIFPLLSERIFLIEYFSSLARRGDRPIRNCPVGNFREVPDCREGDEEAGGGLSISGKYKFPSCNDAQSRRRCLIK
jgi:hypothetical protein